MVSNWPKITDTLVTSVDKFAGDYLNRVSDYFAGVDIGLTDANWNPYIITKTKFGNISLQIADLTASAFYVTIQGRNATLTANKTIQVPDMGATATDEILLRTIAQAITGKTFDLASNVLPETGKAAGAILKYDGTEYTGLPRGTANQVLVTNAGATDVNWATMAKVNLPATIVHTDQTNTWGAFDQIFPSGRFYIFNPAGSFKYKVVGAAITADRQAFEPLLTADDTRVYQAMIQPLTNKTVDGRLNTMPNVVKWNSARRYGKLTMSMTRAYGEGRLQDLQEYGDFVVVDIDASGYFRQIQTPAAVGGCCGYSKFHNASAAWRRLFTPFIMWQFQLAVPNYPLANMRLFFGFSSVQGLIPNSDTPLGSADSGFIIGYRKATTTDTNYMIFNNDGTGAAPAPTDTGLAIPTSATPHILEISMSATDITWTIRNLAFTVLATGTISSRIPSTSIKLYFSALYYVTSAVAQGIVTRNMEADTGG